MKKLLFALMILTAVISACKNEKKPQKPAAVPVSAAVEGAQAPDFSIKDLNGAEIKLSSLKGQVVLVNFWATWCPPCKEEIPSMMKLNQSMAGKPFKMLAISIDEGGKGAVEAYFKKSGLSLPAYLDTETKVAQLYGTTGVPETFIVDKKGTIIKKIIGGMDWSAPDVIAFIDDLTKK